MIAPIQLDDLACDATLLLPKLLHGVQFLRFITWLKADEISFAYLIYSHKQNQVIAWKCSCLILKSEEFSQTIFCPIVFIIILILQSKQACVIDYLLFACQFCRQTLSVVHLNPMRPYHFWISSDVLSSNLVCVCGSIQMCYDMYWGVVELKVMYILNFIKFSIPLWVAVFNNDIREVSQFTCYIASMVALSYRAVSTVL